MKKEYNFSKMKGVQNPLKGKKIGVSIYLSHEVINYFKNLSAETSIPYQKLIDMCASIKRKS